MAKQHVRKGRAAKERRQAGAAARKVVSDARYAAELARKKGGK